MQFLDNDKKSQREDLYRNIIKSKEFSMRKFKIDRESFEGNNFEKFINGINFDKKKFYGPF